MRLTEAPFVAEALGVTIADLLPSTSPLLRMVAKSQWTYSERLGDLESAEAEEQRAKWNLEVLLLLLRLSQGSREPYEVTTSDYRFAASATGHYSASDMEVEDLARALGISEDSIQAGLLTWHRAREAWLESGRVPESLARLGVVEEPSMNVELADHYLGLVFFADVFRGAFPNVTFHDLSDDVQIGQPAVLGLGDITGPSQ